MSQQYRPKDLLINFSRNPSKPKKDLDILASNLKGRKIAFTSRMIHNSNHSYPQPPVTQRNNYVPPVKCEKICPLPRFGQKQTNPFLFKTPKKKSPEKKNEPSLSHRSQHKTRLLSPKILPIPIDTTPKKQRAKSANIKIHHNPQPSSNPQSVSKINCFEFTFGIHERL